MSDQDYLDPSVRMAYDTAQQTSTMMPIIKEELKWTILNKRHVNGLGDIDLAEKKPKIKQELTPKEKDRRERRKAQNRKAAERCRKKKQKENDQLHVDYELEQLKTQQLTEEVEKLKREKLELQRQLDEHAFGCVRNFTPSPNTTPHFDQQGTFDFSGYPPCFAGFQPMQNPLNPQNPPTEAMTSPQQRDVMTPFPQDPFDDDNFMYPQCPGIKAEPTTQPSCNVAALDAILPEIEGTLNFDFQPISPDIALGRQSISDYLDLD